MFFEWTLRLLATLFPNSRGDAVALWSGLSKNQQGFLVGNPSIVLVNGHPRTPARSYCSFTNLAQLMSAELVLCEIIPALKRDALLSTTEADTALQEIAPKFLGMVMLVSSQDRGDITLPSDPLLASTVGGEELLLNLEALRQLLSGLTEGLRKPFQPVPLSVVSDGIRMKLIPWGPFIEPDEV